MTILTNEDIFTPTYLSLKKVTSYLTYIIIAGAILYVVIRTAYSIYKLNKTNSLKLTAIKSLQIFGCLLGTCLFTILIATFADNRIKKILNEGEPSNE